MKLLFVLLAFFIGMYGFMYGFMWGCDVRINDTLSHVKTPQQALNVKLGSIPINETDGITDAYSVQAVQGFRMYQPTFNPTFDGWILQ